MFIFRKEGMFLPYKFLPYILIISALVVTGCDRKSQITEPDDDLPPVMPAGLRIYYASDGNIGLEWMRNSEPDLKGYKIFRSINDTSQFILLGFTSDDFIVDDSLDYNSTYFYYLVAVDDENRESSRTPIISATPLNRLTPLTPRNLQINARSWNNRKEIFLWWDKGQETDLRGYNIYRSISAGFNADTSTFIAFTSSTQFTDANSLEYYKLYYYKIRAVDKGNLESSTTGEIYDQVFEPVQIVFPADKSVVEYFENFRIITTGAEATYKIILQSNQYFGELWSSEFKSAEISDTIEVPLGYFYLERNKTYFWRVAGYSGNSSEPNSISALNSFTIQP